MSDWFEELERGVPLSDDPLDQIWYRLSRPFDVIGTVAALTGHSHATVSHLVGVIVATSPEATEVLEQFPSTVRSLATSIQTHAERCVGSLRGPVLWSETMSARASSYGDEGLFICMAPSRAYDIDENQVLVRALLDIVAAAKEVEDATLEAEVEHDLLGAARINGHEAARFAGHPSLQRVSRKRPKSRAVKRTRTGKHARSYRPALAMLERTANPVETSDIRPWCDARTRAQHAAFARITQRLELRGGHLPPFRVEQGVLYAGPVQYQHGRTVGDQHPDSGIVIGDLLVDVPDDLAETSRDRAAGQLATRAGRRRSMVILDDTDVDRAVDLAIELTTR